MDSPKKIYDRFFKAAKAAESSYGRGFNKFLHHETGLSTGFISLVLKGKKQASPKAQMAIATACDLDYSSFFVPESQPIQPLNQNISKKFKNKHLAEELITKLIDIESIDQMAFIKVVSNIDGIIKKLKSDEKEDRHTSGE